MKKSILKSIFKPIAIVAFAVMGLTSCSGDDDGGSNNGGGNNNRNVKLEISGNFTGSGIAAFPQANGGYTTENFTSLPWVKQITYEASVPQVGMTVNGNGGVAGQTVSVKVYGNGVLKSTTPATANADGIFTLSIPGYTFN